MKPQSKVMQSLMLFVDTAPTSLESGKTAVVLKGFVILALLKIPVRTSACCPSSGTLLALYRYIIICPKGWKGFIGTETGCHILTALKLKKKCRESSILS